MSHITKLIAAQAGEYGFYLVDAAMGENYAGPPRKAWRIICDNVTCRAKFETASWGPKTGPSMMVKNMHRLGWAVVWRKPPLCPKCAHPREEKSAMPGDVQSKELAPVQMGGGAATAPLTGPHGKIGRKVHNLLEAHFDDSTGLYLDGWSDERIAKDAGASADIVKRTRREGYGELKEDPEIALLREMLAQATLKVGEATFAIQDVRRRLDAHELVRAR